VDTLEHIDDVLRRGYYVYSVSSFSSDGNRIVSVSNDSTIWIWNLLKAECMKKIKIKTNKVNSICFIPDGSHILSASENDSIIRIWDVATGECIKMVEGHTDEVKFISFSPDGQYMVSTSKDKTVRLWNGATYNSVKRLASVSGVISPSLSCFSLDGERIAEVLYKDIYIIEDEGRKMRKLEGHNAEVCSISFSPDGKYLVSAAYDEIRIWDATTGICVYVWDALNDVASICFSSDGRRIIAVCSGGTLIIRDFPSLQTLMDEARERFKNRPLTKEERRKYYLN
jgi:WD40 repeat protein